MKIFVVGGSGTIGRRAVAELVRAGHDVTALARSAAARAVVERAGARAVAHPLGRALVLGQTHARAAALSTEYARNAVQALRDSTGFEATLAATAARRYSGHPPLDVPVTVAFGSRDRLLRGRSRRLDRLPPQTRTAALPGCGHLPMADDPALVAALITAAARGAAQPA